MFKKNVAIVSEVKNAIKTGTLLLRGRLRAYHAWPLPTSRIRAVRAVSRARLAPISPQELQAALAVLQAPFRHRQRRSVPVVQRANTRRLRLLNAPAVRQAGMARVASMGCLVLPVPPARPSRALVQLRHQAASTASLDTIRRRVLALVRVVQQALTKVAQVLQAA